MVIKSYQFQYLSIVMRLLMVISKLSVVINGYWLSTSYQCLLRFNNGYQSVIVYQWLLVINKLSIVIMGY